MSLLRRIVPGAAGWSGSLVEREWLVTNGLGGYASGSIAGVMTRRYHGLLVAALPAPLGRVLMLSHLAEELQCGDDCHRLNSREHVDGLLDQGSGQGLAEFRYEQGLPVWEYRFGAVGVEKRVLMPHLQNTVHVTYRVTGNAAPARLVLRPSAHIRPHDASVSTPRPAPYVLTAVENRFELSTSDCPTLRMVTHGAAAAFTVEGRDVEQVLYRVEQARGYDSAGSLWSPGYFAVTLEAGASVTLILSTEPWDTMLSLTPAEAREAEEQRRLRLLWQARPGAREGLGAELVLAADQFVVTPAGRVQEAARAHAAGDEVRTVIAGYHWFTDWGRDTMIALEGLTLASGRHREAGYILRTFSHYMREGLIPNLFPEGQREGLYHTADATLWYFHAIARYVAATGDRRTLRVLLPRLRESVERHMAGTRFGICLDPADGLLRQGQEGYQLTWMDAKVDDWVVTPRRGKAVEINALWYNALRLMEDWLSVEDGEAAARPIREAAAQVHAAFNERFWFEGGGYLYDVVDGENGEDSSCRPNQLFSFSLGHPVLNQDRWARVLDVVESRLLTPVGLRSLAPGERDYKPQYYGDLRARDAAYHQGTVWAWLIGPFIDAWLRVHPGERRRAREFLSGFDAALERAAVGTLAEIFDAEEPFAPRGCVAQAWSVAEVLRCWVATSDETGTVRREADEI